VSVPIFRAFGISRLRMASDGVGVTTLVCGYGCPLRCRYCLNPQSWSAGIPTRDYTPEGLWKVLKIDDLYFRATGGGVTFGGGEPLLYADFLPAFRAVCGPDWTINVETCLAVERSAVALAAEAADVFFVDIKAWDDDLYRAYTGRERTLARENLAWLLARVGPERVVVRVPAIPNFVTPEAADAAAEHLRAMGVTRIDRFAYRLPKNEKEMP